ncbi:MAG: NTPase [Methanomassiliicoccales archaeon]|jgi:nucleoside-triphosphatase|nr:NTPase [Methanomassiliicoccales archaeon]
MASSSKIKKNFLITGPPGIGKTTVITKVAKTLENECGGFYTTEVRIKGIRKGFEIITLDGMSGILADVSLSNVPKVGKYGVNLEDIDQVAVASIRKAMMTKNIVIIDEIGKMEVLSPLFRSAVIAALDSPKPVIGTIAERGDPFFDAIREREDVEILVVSLGNRDDLPGFIIQRLRKFLSTDDQ